MKKTVLSNDDIASAKLEARNWYLDNHEVPTITVMRNELGVELANVLISNFDHITKKIMFIHDDDDIPPKVKMSIPIKATHHDICDRGDMIEQKIIHQMLKDALDELLLELKREFCADLQRQEDELSKEYDQLKQDVLANMKILFDKDEREYIESEHANRLNTAKLVTEKFKQVKPHVFSAVARRIAKLINRDHSRFLRQRCREQQQVYIRLRDIVLAESHAKNVKFMCRILNEYGTSISDEVQSLRSILTINNIYMIIKERYKHQTKFQTLKEKLDQKFRCIVDKCEELLRKKVVAKKHCPNIRLWKRKCLWLISNYESYIESTTNKKEDHGKYFLDVKRLMENFESITEHDHGFYQCCYESGGLIEYFDRAKKELIESPQDLPVIIQQVRPKPKKISTKPAYTINEPPIVVKGCYPKRSESIFDWDSAGCETSSSTSSIEYQGHIYASTRSYGRVANKLFPQSSEASVTKAPTKATFHWDDGDDDSMSDDDFSTVDQVVEIAAKFREELIRTLDLNELARHIFHIILESTSKLYLLKSTSSIQERPDNHGTILIPAIPSATSEDIHSDSLNLLMEVENKFVKCIDSIATPSAIIEFIRKIERAKTVKKKRIFRARDSVMLTQKKLKQHRLYDMHRQSASNQSFDIASNELEDDDFNPPLYFHENCLDFHYVFHSYLNKITDIVPDNLLVPDNTKVQLEESMVARTQLHYIDVVKQHLRNSRILKKLNQKLRLKSHGILRNQNEFSSRERIDDYISKMQLDKLLEFLEKFLRYPN